MMEQIKTISMKQLIIKMPSLFFGLFLYAIGILSTLYSHLGMSPWDVFHMGIVNYTPLSLGQASQLTGLAILLISYFIGVVPGLSSVFNMIFIGYFVDFVDRLGIFRTPDTLLGRIVMLLFGIFIIGWATYFYLRVALGAGPRDGFMEGMVKKTSKPVWAIRAVIEMTVLILGYFMGGPVGIGTIITAGLIGFSVQFAFKIGKYDSKHVNHINLIELYRILNKEQTPIDLPDK